MKNNHYESLFEGDKYGQLNMASVPRVWNVHQSPLIVLQHFLFWKLTIRHKKKKKKKRPVHGIQLFSWRLHHSFFFKKTICFLRVVIVISELKHHKLSEVSDQTINAQPNCGQFKKNKKKNKNHTTEKGRTQKATPYCKIRARQHRLAL